MPHEVGPARVRLAVGEVRHARHRPRAHAFRYRALFIRVPMRALDRAFDGQALLSHDRFNLFSFHEADHGVAGVAPLAWIDGLLRAERIVDADGDLWLDTFPRVLGYAFKPVSFWFCHRRDGALRAVLVEVNNTFGERHCYLLAHADGRPIANGEELAASKVFHVSPFCEVKGRYRFRFMDAGARTLARIDYEDEQGLLLATSLSGHLQPATTRSLFMTFVSHPLFSFGVVARIHWQALRLFFKRAPFFSKPAAPTVEVSR